MTIELEKLIIAEILSEPDNCAFVTELISVDMFSGKEAGIYRVIERHFGEGKNVDLYTISKEIGDFQYLTKITLLASSANALHSHCLQLREKYIVETLSRYSMQINHLITAKEPAQKLLEFAQSGIEDIFELVSSGVRGFEHISKITERAIAAAEDRVKKKQAGESIGVTTGLRPLDKMLHYMRGGQLIVLAARPAMGKTALMLHFARHAAYKGHSVCMYQLEMSAISLADRMIFAVEEIDTFAYKTGEFADWDKLWSAQSKLSKLPIFIDANPKVSMSYIRNHARVMRKKGKCDIIYIDYLQLVDMEDKKNREQEVAKVSRQCKMLSKELDVPVVLLAQLNREVEADKTKRPELRHLRESGAIEQDADVVLFPYRAAYYGIEEVSIYDKHSGTRQINSEGIMEIIIAKNRDGAIGDVAVKHNENLTNFENI